MKRKRILLCILCSVLFLFSISALTVYAHPGGTDSNGGHKDGTTGEYHYHHGYDAHNHYDMDGDGVIDCPFDFDDQTGANSGSSSSSSSSSNKSQIIIPPNFPTIPFNSPINIPEATNHHEPTEGNLSQTTNTFHYDPPEKTIKNTQREIIVFFVSSFVIALLFYILAKLRDYPKPKESPSATCLPEPSNSSPSKQEASISREYTICHTIWLCTYHISRHCGFSNNSFARGHIWATLFYITAKYIRDQSIIDQIYTHFDAASADVADGDPFPASILSLVRHGYRQFVPILNASGIDPRTQEGIQQLWTLIIKEDFKYKDPHSSAIRAYFDYTQILISNISTYRKSEDHSET